MANIHFSGGVYGLLDGETVLDGLERQGVQIASSCRSGVCQSCMLRAVEGEIPAAAQKTLRDTLRAQRYFLACSCVPAEDLVVELGSAQREYRAAIEGIQFMNAGTVRLRLRSEERFEYFPGQFLNLRHEAGHIRSYSIASTSEDPFLELHIALLPGGRISTWIQDGAAPGDAIKFLGPLGNCFYTSGKPEQPLLLAGTGTGLAPLYGIARDALRQGHTGPVHLFHGALQYDRLYLGQELRELAAAYPQFHYHPSVFRGPAPDDTAVGAIDELALQAFPSLKGWRVFLCGHPDLVKKLQRKTFLAGAGLKEIFADAFVPAAAPAAASAPAPASA